MDWLWFKFVGTRKPQAGRGGKQIFRREFQGVPVSSWNDAS
jgi:hypothetical protein